MSWYKLAILAVLLFCVQFTIGQDNLPQSKHGYAIAPYGDFHVLVVFAEIVFDGEHENLDPMRGKKMGGWPKGKLPNWKDGLFDYKKNLEKGKGYMTQYFREASFGEMNLSGDYVNQIISIPISTIKNDKGKVVTKESYASKHYKRALIDTLNNINFQTSNKQDFQEFDKWTLTSPGKPNINKPNEKWDMVMVIWRNLHLVGVTDGNGYVSKGSIGKIQGRGSDTFSMFGSYRHNPKTVMRHEFSHMLYGGNNFHTASSGVGSRRLLAPTGGWSNMSNSDRCSPVYNGWDRERMGWKNPENDFLINCQCENDGSNGNSYLVPNQQACINGIYRLRDFVATGDVVKIKLPHIPSGKKQQYLWIENHTLPKGKIDHNESLVPGLYAFISVGKDKLSGDHIFGGPNNYTSPLVGEGHYDFIKKPKEKTIIIKEKLQNPTTGYNYLHIMSEDMDGDGKLKTSTRKKKVESFWVEEIKREGLYLEDDYFSFMHMPMYGARGIAFTKEGNNKIGPSENPTAFPILTHYSPGNPKNEDNRSIQINGLSIEILERAPNGDLILKIRWDDYSISQNRRWAGSLEVNEKLILEKGVNLFIDQGESPVITKLDAEWQGTKYFAPRSHISFKEGSNLVLKENASLVLSRGSSISFEKGSEIKLEKNAEIIVQSGGKITIEDGFQNNSQKITGFYFENNSWNGSSDLDNFPHKPLKRKMKKLAFRP